MGWVLRLVSRTLGREGRQPAGEAHVRRRSVISFTKTLDHPAANSGNRSNRPQPVEQSSRVPSRPLSDPAMPLFLSRFFSSVALAAALMPASSPTAEATQPYVLSDTEAHLLHAPRPARDDEVHVAPALITRGLIWMLSGN